MKKFSKLVNKMGVKAKKAVRDRTKQFALQMDASQKTVDPFKLTTTVFRSGLYCFKVTQELLADFKMGHYSWVLMNVGGDIVRVGSSSGAPPSVLTMNEIEDLALYAIREWERHIKAY